MRAEQESVVVGLGEIKITKDPQVVLTCLGLGSCIGLAAYDPVARVAAMAHIVLPADKGTNGQSQSPAKYANTAIPALLQEMKAQGGTSGRIVVKLAGGARMSLAAGLDSIFKIGEQNIAATTAALKAAGLQVAASDTGGEQGRTMKLYTDSGQVTVVTAGTKTNEL